MHFEILVEDQSGKKFLDEIVPKMIGPEDSVRVKPYRGIGRLPKDLKPATDPRKRILLDQLPRLLQGYGKTFAGYGPDYPATVIVVCDLDDRCLKAFRTELVEVLDGCEPRPGARFCFAIEEGEAWLLGDLPAVRRAYPHARAAILDAYENDSICGTWEVLADAVYPGGASALSGKGWQAVGMEKSRWAESISPHMEIGSNQSPSFRYFRETVRFLASPVGEPD